MAFITCRNVSLAYENNVVVSNLNFEICKGDYLCIVGENGSGKSTLLKALLGFLTPVEGSIEKGDGLKNNCIGYLPQQTKFQRDFPASVFEIVRSGCLNQKRFKLFFNKSDIEKTKSTMELLGITKLKNRCYRELSGGQQQRVLLARALCATKTVLLLDEPTAGLDPKVTQELYDIIDNLHKKNDVTIVMISHDMKAALSYSTKILQLHNGKMFFGTTSEFKNKIGFIEEN